MQNDGHMQLLVFVSAMDLSTIPGLVSYPLPAKTYKVFKWYASPQRSF